MKVDRTHTVERTDRRGKRNSRRGFVVLWILIIFGGFFGRSLLATTSFTVSRDAMTMGTRLHLAVVAGDRPTALRSSEAALRSVENTGDRLSTWKRGTELDRLNHSEPGTWFALSPELNSDLETARYWWRESGGAFDPGVASLVKAWDLRGSGRVPVTGEIDGALRLTGLGLLELSSGKARRMVAGFGVDEGGFGKGIALRDAARAALAAGAECVELNFGGQLLIRGVCGERLIGVADPRRRSSVVATVTLTNGSAATSGASERWIEVAGERMAHILNPLTGRPVNNWGSVTVIADDPVVADCCATALYVMGPERGFEWVSQRDDVEAVFVKFNNGKTEIISTPGVRDRVMARNPSVRHNAGTGGSLRAAN